MLTKERQQIIRAKLIDDGRVIASDLANEFSVSEDTIRRDLRELAQNGICRRVYGGALRLTPENNTTCDANAVSPAQKNDMAQLAASIMTGQRTVFIDAGPINLSVIAALPVDCSFTIITNAPSIAIALESRHRCDVIMIGGNFDQRQGVVLGSRALIDVQALHPDLFVLGACSLDPEVGITTLNAEEATFKRHLIKQCRSTITVATNDQLGTVSPFAVSSIKALDYLILEQSAPAAMTSRFKQNGVRIMQPRS